MAKPKKIPCPICSDDFLPMNAQQVVCGPACAVRYNSEEEVEKRFELMKAESMPLSKAMFETRAVFQKCIRLRDDKDGCISCNKKEVKQWHAGHYFPAEEYPGLIFHPDNAHKQCPHCNQHLKGNVIPYREKLIQKIGVENFSYLELLSEDAKKKVYSKEELLGIKRLYKDKIKSLNKK